MKFVTIALILVGTAVICKYGDVSNLFRQPAIIAEPPLTEAKYQFLRFLFPHLLEPPAPIRAAEGVNEKSFPLSIQLLSKAETMVLIAAAAARHNVPPALVQSIVAAESNFDCAAISLKGAIGLMQLMPATARQFGGDPTDPAENIEAGTRYLRYLMDRYRNTRNSIKHVIAAYNAGPGAVDRYRGVPPFRETRSYVARVLFLLKQFGAT